MINLNHKGTNKIFGKMFKMIKSQMNSSTSNSNRTHLCCILVYIMNNLDSTL